MPNVARSSSARSWASRNSTASADPAPPMIVVRSAVTRTWRGPAELVDGHRLQGEAGVLAVDLAAGDRGDVLQLAQPPVAEARAPWIATHWKMPLTWLCTSMLSAEPSTFSAMMTSGRGARMILSSSGISCWTLVIFSLHSRM